MLRWRRGVLAIVCVLALGCAGCSKDDPKPTDPKTLSTSSSVSPPSSSPSLTADQQAIISQYKAYFTAVTELDGQSTLTVMNELTQYGYPVVAASSERTLATIAQSGWKIGGYISYGPMVVAVQDLDGSVRECRDGSSETIVDASTGMELSHGDPGQQITATMHKDADSLWRITNIDVIEKTC